MELRNFFLQMETQLGAGIPVIRALTLVAANQSGSLRRKIEDLGHRVEKGATLSGAMTQVGAPFQKLHIAFVRFGEETGCLDRVFGSLAEHAEGDVRMARQLINAMIYPGFVLAVALIAGPVISATSGGRPLDSALMPAVLNLVTLAMAVVALGALYRVGGGGAFDKVLIHLPYIGNIMYQLALGRFARTLAIGTKAGVPIMQAMETAIDVSGNAWLQQRLQGLAAQMARGQGIADTLRRVEVLPPTLVEMIRTGEESGRLPEMLEKTAQYHEQEASYRLTQFSAVFPTVIFLLVAAYAIFFIIMPNARQIFDLSHVLK